MTERMKITKAGQVSVPAAIRRRWGAETVLVEDRGDHLVMRPASENPVDRLYGIFAKEVQGGPSLEEIREQMRAEEIEAEETKARRHGYTLPE